MSQAKGNFVIMNSAGSVVIAGIAKTLQHSTMSAGITDATEVQTRNDAKGVPRTMTKNFNKFTLDLDITPGIGGLFASAAELTTDFCLTLIGASIVTSGFPGATSTNTKQTLNWPADHKAIVKSASMNASGEGLGSIKITAEKYFEPTGNGDTTGTWIDFTGTWTALA